MLVEVVINIDDAFDNLSLGEQTAFIFEHLDVLDVDTLRDYIEDDSKPIYIEEMKILSSPKQGETPKSFLFEMDWVRLFITFCGHVDILHGDFALKIDGWTK